MTDNVEIAIIATISPTVLGLAGLVVAILNRTSADRIEKKAGIIEDKVNGHTEKLVRVEKALSFKEGVKAGTKAGKAAK